MSVFSDDESSDSEAEKRRRRGGGGEEEERNIRTAANKIYIPMTIKMQIFNEEEKEKKALVAMLLLY